jgi:TolA-binding protein
VFAVLVIAAAGPLSGPGTTSAQADGQAFCSVYKTGRAFVEAGNFGAALKDFQTVVERCPQNDIKAQALLERGLIFLRQWPRQIGEARKVAEVLTSQYLNTPTAPDGYVLAGLIELEDNRNFQAALEQFTRVNENITSSSQAFAKASFHTAETYRLAHQPEAALVRFRDTTLKYPTTEFAAKALLGLATGYVRQGQFIQAMETLQRVRREFAGSPEATLALQRNTILHRLHMRGKLQTANVVMPGKAKLRDGVALSADRSGRILVAHRDGMTMLRADTGDPVRQEPMPSTPQYEVTGVGVTGGNAVLVRRHVFVFDDPKISPFLPGIPQQDSRSEHLEIMAFLANWRGEWLVADGRTDTIRRYAADGNHIGVFGPSGRRKVVRMAQNDIDDVAVLDDGTKNIHVFDRAGAAIGEIPRRPAAMPREYELDSPVDLAFDVLGNLYVLDAAKSAIVVFDPRLRYATTIQLPVKDAAGIRRGVALTVDETGRIFVLDRDGQQVVGYR